jgi:hypothetical protein
MLHLFSLCCLTIIQIYDIFVVWQYITDKVHISRYTPVNHLNSLKPNLLIYYENEILSSFIILRIRDQSNVI